MINRHIKKIVFFSSFAILAFEIILIRMYSIRFSYHYASLIISIAMTGLVSGGIVVFLKKDLLLQIHIEKYAALLSLSCPLIFILSHYIPMDYYKIIWERIQILYLFFFMLMCSIPFFIYAIILSLALSSDPSASPWIYATDLAGASAGVAFAVISMDHISPDYIIAIPPLLLAVVLFTQIRGSPLRFIFLSAVLFLSALTIFGQFATAISPYKGFAQAMKEDDSRHIKTIYSSHSRLDVFENPRMKFAPGLSVTYTKPIPQGFGIALDGEIAGVTLDVKNPSDISFLSYMPSSLPYLLKTPEKIMVIGFKNSIDALAPHYFGAANIILVEKDHSIIKFLLSQYPKDSIYSKHLYETSGRMFLKKNNEYFDVISLSRTGFFPSGTFGIQEDFELTIEALQTYLSHLKEGGMLSIQMFLVPPSRYELRMANNIIRALENEGFIVNKKHLLIFRSWDTMNYLIKKNGFSSNELSAISTFLDNNNFDIIYGDKRSDTQFITGIDYPHMFGKLIDKSRRDSFIASYPFDITATSDNKPFFHYFFRLDKLKEMYELSGRKWSYFIHDGMALPFILFFQVLISILLFASLFIAPGFRQNASFFRRKIDVTSSLNSLYFIFIGFAFMFVEIFFIHRLILTYASPIRAFSVTLIILLISSGTGSFVCGYLSNRNALKIMFVAPLVLLSCFTIMATMPDILNIFYFLIPSGFFLGFFFPVGMRIFCAHNIGLVPVLYAMNGAASIIAPLLASIIGVAYGLNMLLLLAFILYSSTLFFLRFACHRHKEHTP